jgi:hypothetical protein
MRHVNSRELNVIDLDPSSYVLTVGPDSFETSGGCLFVNPSSDFGPSDGSPLLSLRATSKTLSDIISLH